MTRHEDMWNDLEERLDTALQAPVLGPTREGLQWARNTMDAVWNDHAHKKHLPEKIADKIWAPENDGPAQEALRRSEDSALGDDYRIFMTKALRTLKNRGLEGQRPRVVSIFGEFAFVAVTVYDVGLVVPVDRHGDESDEKDYPVYRSFHYRGRAEGYRLKDLVFYSIDDADDAISKLQPLIWKAHRRRNRWWRGFQRNLVMGREDPRPMAGYRYS